MLFAGAGAGGAGVVVVDVATMSVAVVPVLETLHGRRGRGGVAAAAAAGVAVVVVGTSGEGGAATVRWRIATVVAAAAVPLGGSTTTPTATPAARAAALTRGLVELEHSGGGLIANDVAEHLELPLHCADGRIGRSQGFLGGGIRNAKVADGIGQRRRGGIVFGGSHAVAMLRRRGSCESGDVDCRFPEDTEGGEGHVVGGVVASRDPCFVFLGEEAGAMQDADADVDDVVVGDGILG